LFPHILKIIFYVKITLHWCIFEKIKNKINRKEMDNKKGFWWPFALGAAVGVAVAYFMKSEKKEELVNDIKEAARKAKSELEELLKKAGTGNAN
jgi:hypothetical protein